MAYKTLMLMDFQAIKSLWIATIKKNINPFERLDLRMQSLLQ